MNDTSRAARTACDLMALAARTAPKARGADSLVIRIASGEELQELAEAVRRAARREEDGFFERDAGNIAGSEACLLIGVRGHEPAGADCGGCGYLDCVSMSRAVDGRKAGSTPYGSPNCAIKMIDLGVAIGSAVKTASLLNLDNRVMYTAGVGARALGWLPGCTVACGIPVAASGKNPFFDRTWGR
ncbi:MAG TPA: DUF2148 domain-containing protein [Methanoregulaceae archaeon]|nr:DUF2148 domain-containing protein [Methanoregulaceae archaeon]